MKDDHARRCAICGGIDLLTFHHLIPKSCHRNKWFRKRFDTEEMRARGIVVCRPCHNFIHRRHSEKRLGREFNTLEALLADEVIVRFADWAKKRRKCHENTS